MTGFKSVGFKVGAVLAVLGTALIVAGCSQSLAKGAIGRVGSYDYSPSVIQVGQVRQFWWCGEAVNPNDSSQNADAILYESVDLTTHATHGPVVVLAETPGAWDSAYTCNPKVIEGSFSNPLGDGHTYQYAMYYVGTPDGQINHIGVAFSDDGIKWAKYPQPVIQAIPQAGGGYGVGQPALYNTDHKSAITMFYEDSNPSTHHVVATSTDGLHFTVQGPLTTSGLDLAGLDTAWGDMAYDSTNGDWYAVYDRKLRDPSTTGGITERGQMGVELYRIPNAALLTGSTPWQQLYTFDTNLTGNEANFLAGLVRDPYGSVNVGAYPTIQMYVSASNPPPSWDASPSDAGNSGRPNQWDIVPAEWVPNTPLMPLYRYFNSHVHEVTTGWIDPSGGFKLQSTLGHLYESPQQGATVPFYGCKRGSKDYFVSLDGACEGERILGRNGYGYSQPVGGLNLIALYRCSSGHDHFASQDPKCEGQTTDKLLGYVVP